MENKDKNISQKDDRIFFVNDNKIYFAGEIPTSADLEWVKPNLIQKIIWYFKGIKHKVKICNEKPIICDENYRYSAVIPNGCVKYIGGIDEYESK